MDEWYEDETFWRELYPFIFSDARFDIAGEQIEKALELAGFKGGPVLDLCCGPGRHTIEMAMRGIEVTAVDRSRFLLDKAKQSASGAGVQIEFVLSDMREFVRPGAFALVLNLFTSFGYFDDREDELRVLENIHKSLKPGGALLIDVMGKEVLARKQQDTSCEEGPDGTLLIQRHEVFDSWSRIRNEWILLKDGEAKRFRFRHWVYSGQELKGLLMIAGFDKVRLYGDLTGSEYGVKATRLVALAQKSL